MAKKAPKTPAPLHLEGSLSIQNATALHGTLLTYLQETAALFTLDLTGITACDSAGLQLLCSARRSVLSAGREWRLTNPSEAFYRACTEAAINPTQLGL